MHYGAVLLVLLLTACSFSKPRAVECAGADLALKLPVEINDVAALMRFEAELDRVQGQLFCLLQNSVSSDNYLEFFQREVPLLLDFTDPEGVNRQGAALL